MKQKQFSVPGYYIRRGVCALLALLFAAGALVSGTMALQTYAQDGIENEGRFLIEKTVENADGSAVTAEQAERQFEFTVKLKGIADGTIDLLLNDELQSFPVTDGVFVIHLRHGEQAMVFGLPMGVGYAVEMSAQAAYGYFPLLRAMSGYAISGGVSLPFVSVFHPLADLSLLSRD